nr:uncharacterized protein LOC129255905 [Lytechinus pictus]
MLDKKKIDSKQSPIPEEVDDAGGQGKENDDYPWRRLSNEATRRGLHPQRSRSKSDEGMPLLSAYNHDGGSSRRLRSRRRRLYAKDNGLDLAPEEDEEEDVDIHAGRVRRGSIMIPAMTPKSRNRGRYRKGSQDLAIDEESTFGDDDADIGGKRGSRSQLLTNTVLKNDQESKKRRSRSRRSSMMPQSEQGKLMPSRCRFLSLPGSSRRSRRGSVSDVEDDEDDDDDDDGGGFDRLKRGGFLSTGASNDIQKTNKELKEEMRRRNRKRLIRKFKIYCKLITSFHRLCQAYFLSVNTNSSDFQGIHGLLDEPEQELLFDVRKFRANKESGISADARRILSTRPSNRTEKDTYHVLISMRNYPTFCEYPLAMQQQIVGVGFYVSYQAQRIILRQGHWAENFYFILSGSVVVSVMDEGTHQNRTVVYLNRGETFGELGLVNRAKRQATVIARERIEMIVINGNDYTRIFMAGGLSTLLNPQQNDNAFVRNLRFLEGWPLHRLAENPKKCIFSYFKRGDVLIRESRRSDWIIIVKSGSCQVMKLLRKARPKSRRNNTADEEDDAANKQQKRWSNRLTSKAMAGTLIENFEQRKKREEFEDFMKDLNVNEDGSAKSHNRGEQRTSSDDSDKRDEHDVEIDDEWAEEEIDFGDEDDKETAPPSNSKSPMGDKNTPTKLKSAYLSRKRSKSMDGVPSVLFEEEEDNGVEEGVNPIADILFLHNVQQKADKQKSNVGKKKTLLDDIGGSDVEGVDVDENTEPIWVRVQTLIKGSVFGLADMAYESQPSFAVISNGAECILLSKKLYMEHASMRMISKLRTQYQRYPPEEELQMGLEVKLKWDLYKTDTLKGTLKESKLRDRASKFR